MITRNELEQIAHAIADARATDRRQNKIGAGTNCEIALAETFKQLNPRFNEERFWQRVVQLDNARQGIR